MSDKPVIIVLSPDDAEVLNWLSGGWHSWDNCHTEEAKALMAKAHACIDAADNVLDAIRRLEEAGFEIERFDDDEPPMSSADARRRQEQEG